MSDAPAPDRAGRIRGNLAERLLDIATQVTEEIGPAALSMREVQRRAGVSPAAAYRHFADRRALLVAVGQQASGLLADDITRALARSGPPDRADAQRSTARARAGCLAYLEFAAARPQLYCSIFATGEDVSRLREPEALARGGAGRGPYQLLAEVVGDLAVAGAVADQDTEWTNITVWAACHGLASLLQDSPLAALDPEQRLAARDRMLDIVLTGVARSA